MSMFLSLASLYACSFLLMLELAITLDRIVMICHCTSTWTIDARILLFGMDYRFLDLCFDEI